MKKIERMKPEGNELIFVSEMLIGRGKGGKDPETLFKYAVQTNEIKAWRIAEKTSTKILEDEFGFFFSAECKSEKVHSREKERKNNDKRKKERKKERRKSKERKMRGRDIAITCI